MIDLAGTSGILKRGKVLDQFLDRHRHPPFVDKGRTVTPDYTVKSQQPISCVAPAGLDQYVKGLAHHNPVEALALRHRLERIKWRLWHGDDDEALSRAQGLNAD